MMNTPDYISPAGRFAFAATRRFAPLFATQFLGAFNDNLFKTALFVMISFYGLGNNAFLPASQMLNLGALLFILPYFLFSALSGQLSNKFDKAVLARWVKASEVLIMLAAAWGFYCQSALLLLACLFLMGWQSTLFGPLKYAVLPDYLSSRELLLGNSLIESGTFLAILFGQMLGTVLAGFAPLWIGAAVLAVAALGQLASLLMPGVPAKTPNITVNLHIFRSTGQLLRAAWAQKELSCAIIGISWFWFIGSVYTTQLPTFTRLNLGGDESVFNLMLTLFSIGIGLGSIICAALSHGRLHLSLIAVGASGMTVFGLCLVWITGGVAHSAVLNWTGFLMTAHAWPVMGCIAALGFFGGFFSVPLYTWLQTSGSDTFRAHAIAANNIVNGLFMVAAALISAVLIWLFDSIRLLYLIVALGHPVLLVYLMRSSDTLRQDMRQFLWRKK